MTKDSRRTRVILFGDDFVAVVLKGSCAHEVASDSNVAMGTPGPVDSRPTRDEVVTPEASTISRVDNKMPDGTMYAGTSPDTGQAMYATPADAPVTYSFSQAERYAATLDAHRPPHRGGGAKKTREDQKGKRRAR